MFRNPFNFIKFPSWKLKLSNLVWLTIPCLMLVTFAGILPLVNPYHCFYDYIRYPFYDSPLIASLAVVGILWAVSHVLCAKKENLPRLQSVYLFAPLALIFALMAHDMLYAYVCLGIVKTPHMLVSFLYVLTYCGTLFSILLLVQTLIAVRLPARKLPIPLSYIYFGFAMFILGCFITIYTFLYLMKLRGEYYV